MCMWTDFTIVRSRVVIKVFGFLSSISPLSTWRMIPTIPAEIVGGGIAGSGESCSVV